MNMLQVFDMCVYDDVAMGLAGLAVAGRLRTQVRGLWRHARRRWGMRFIKPQHDQRWHSRWQPIMIRPSLGKLIIRICYCANANICELYGESKLSFPDAATWDGCPLTDQLWVVLSRSLPTKVQYGWRKSIRAIPAADKHAFPWTLWMKFVSACSLCQITSQLWLVVRLRCPRCIYELPLLLLIIGEITCCAAYSLNRRTIVNCNSRVVQRVTQIHMERFVYYELDTAPILPIYILLSFEISCLPYEWKL